MFSNEYNAHVDFNFFSALIGDTFCNSFNLSVSKLHENFLKFCN